MRNYDVFYQRLTAPLRRHRKWISWLDWSNKLVTLTMYLAYVALLVGLLVMRDPSLFWRMVLIPGGSFLAISLFRHLLNRPRPYERWAISPLIVKHTKGHAMPSRHVFSATIISMAYLYVYWPLGCFFLGLSVLLGSCRILAGVHYPSDVIVAYLLAGLSASLFWLL
ncbi:phosphatase PAP2 family protein [Streptococcus sp. DD12]|uniref:phosphatase PAP2 family protein n=1 Tax=Streptococcus sp. DD12 TaxID=1777880 RepID=UPI000795507E|nr:phosphatase PAP2 family protein [Streptococcus sp. DD12]KXT76387.1 Phosphatidylglycerophosphatase B [Streptococcus sp. DD12]